MEEDEIRELLEFRKSLAEMREETHKLVTKIDKVLEVLEKLTARWSIKSGKEILMKVEKPEEVTIGGVKEIIPLVTRGRRVGDAKVINNTLHLEPDPTLRLRSEIPPFTSFFVKKVLEPMRESDQERVARGEIRADEILTYNIVEEDGLLKDVEVRGYRDRSRMIKIIRAAAWTFGVMSEKI